jgi:4-aminobutyrate aminotransferase-like enzyme
MHDIAPTSTTVADSPSRVARFNGFQEPSELDEATRRQIERRAQILAPTYQLFYRLPLDLASGSGAYLYDVHGAEYLDMYNNIPAVGHCNARVAAAVHAQMLQLNTHTRYLYPSILDYGERLLSTMPAPVDRVVFTNSGSESNDLAVRVAQKHTAAMGIVVTENAYHGSTAVGAAISPVTRAGAPSAEFPWVRTVPARVTGEIAAPTAVLP